MLQASRRKEIPQMNWIKLSTDQNPPLNKFQTLLPAPPEDEENARLCQKVRAVNPAANSKNRGR